MIGIIGAMDVEVDAVKEMLSEKKEKIISGFSFITGKLYGRDVTVVKCGVGKCFAAVCTEAMILNFSPDVIINTGVAGSLSDDLKICDIAVAENVVQHDMDTSPLGDPVGMISGIDLIYIKADAALSEKLIAVAAKYNIRCRKGTVASGDQFIADPGKKTYLKKQFGAIACEMEGAAVGHVCYINRIPFAILRSISDNASEEAPMNFPAFCAKAAENAVLIIKEYIKNPE